MALALTERRVVGEPVAEDVLRFGNGMVNWYLVRDGDRVAVVDAGFPPDWDKLVRALRGMGLGLDAVSDVVLTHAHVDHTGFAERARTEAGATVHMHPEEVAIARSPLPMAKSERNPLLYQWHPATMALVTSALLMRGPFGQRISEWETFVEGEVLDEVPGRPHVVFCPGHTFGHCALHLPDRGVLFAGDALVTRDPYTGRTGPRLVARAATADSQLALRSLDALEATDAALVLPGHGEPWRDGAREAVRLAREAGAA